MQDKEKIDEWFWTKICDGAKLFYILGLMYRKWVRLLIHIIYDESN
jgi:hypothetical protein